eukprot:8796046-Heterocapsa_arctica.AAC.1
MSAHPRYSTLTHISPPHPPISGLATESGNEDNINDLSSRRRIALDIRIVMSIGIGGTGGTTVGTLCRMSVYYADTGIS